jgi:phosphomannomutase
MSLDQSLVAEVAQWIALDPSPADAALLQKWLDDGNEIDLRRCFNGFLQFGTAGLRGPIGPGPSCMNRAVVHRAAAGIAAYMKARGLTKVVIGRDARYGSEDFTQESAEVFAGAGMEVFVLPRPMATPVLAYATTALGADVGIMVTASHNPPQDNGYKVYLGGVVDGVRYAGSQIVPPADIQIAAEIAKINHLAPKKTGWTVLNDDVFNKYVAATAALARSKNPLKVVYSAMHGVGSESIEAVFKAAGFSEIHFVEEQKLPDPAFPTVAFPNPEEPGAIDLSLALARKIDADIVIANDPDADRCAAAINDPATGWRMLRGDEVGAILGHYIATTMKDSTIGKAFGNSIVSSSILKKIADKHGIEFHETLTGFKWLAKIPNLRYGYEEALGYAVDALSVNDKDGISAALMIAQCAGELKAEGRTMADYLDEIWSTYGFHATEQISIRVNSIAQVDTLLARLRKNPPQSIGGFALTQADDLERPTDGLPPTNGLRYWFGPNLRVIIRPSGTEAKMKCYIELCAPQNEAILTLPALRSELTDLMTAE